MSSSLGKGLRPAALLVGLPLLLVACGGARNSSRPAPQKAPAPLPPAPPAPSLPVPDQPVPNPCCDTAPPPKLAFKPAGTRPTTKVAPAPAPAPVPAPTPVAIQSFKASPANIILGESTTLAWQLLGEAQVNIDNQVGQVSGDQISVSPEKNTTYTLTAANATSSATASVSVVVNPPKPVISVFKATPDTITMGQNSALSWQVSEGATLGIDQGVGTVTGVGVAVKPTVSTVYTLTATNKTGSATATASVTALGPPGAARNGHTATLLSNGKILLAGGEAIGGYTPTADLYDPATGAISSTGSLNTARASHTATLLPDGKVLIVGGQAAGGFPKTGELYDPATGLFSVVDSNARPLAHRESFHSRAAVTFGIQFHLTPVVGGEPNLSKKSGNGIGLLFPSMWLGNAVALCPRVDYLVEKRPQATYPVVGALALKAETLLVQGDFRYYPLWTNAPSKGWQPYLFAGAGFNKTIREASAPGLVNPVTSNTTRFTYSAGLGLMIARPFVLEIKYVGYKLPPFMWNSLEIDPRLTSSGIVGSIGFVF